MSTQELHQFRTGETDFIVVYDQAEMAAALQVKVLDLIDMVQAGIFAFFRKDDAGNHFFSEAAYLGNLDRGKILRTDGYRITVIKDKAKHNPLPWAVMHMNQARSWHVTAKRARAEALTRALGAKVLLPNWTYLAQNHQWSLTPPGGLWLGD